ncbi:MAG: tRNA uridine-5-carboxymethylaminomethyl(34) synthesis GTPase MnmE [Bauldia sp.]
MFPDDTIFALSSGPPPAGIAVIRMSGPGVRFGLETLIGSVPEPRRASLRPIGTRQGDPIDRGLVLFLAGPASFTGEDMAELHVHGGRAVIAGVLAELERLPGFRAAEAGEFTRRAFVNRRMDLTQVEGLADLVQAETEAQRRQAVKQAGGRLGALYEQWRGRLVRARAMIEAELDFPDEDDVPDSISAHAWADVAGLEQEIVNHISDRRGERLRDGAEIVVLGPPNVGKSSLINAIAQREVAIVTPDPGTTRDLIEVRLDLAGYPVTLVDTAGLREAGGAVEREGIKRAEERAARADLVLWLSEAGAPSPPPLGEAPVVRVGTKIDAIDSVGERSRLAVGFDVVLSAVTGDGVNDLLSMLSKRIAADMAPAESPLMTRARHRTALAGCVEAIRAALGDDQRPLELRAEDLRRAGDALGRITGRIDVEEMLDQIFREFCIGK